MKRSAYHPTKLGCAVLSLILSAALGCAAKSPAPAGEQFHFGSHHYAVTARDPSVQAAFDRGLRQTYGFNYQAAEDEFIRAAQLDPECAMAWWGIAFVNGPHINFPIVPELRAERAWSAVNRALRLAPAASERERLLIEALAKRFSSNPSAERAPLDRAYAEAMREVWRRYPDDVDIGTLFAQSMMDLRPWDLWTAEGNPQPGTEEIVSTLETVLKLNSKHPGANHYYIHTVEASPEPKKGEAAADRLSTLVPGSGHLTHMPAHIYARVGRWRDATEANARAIAADEYFRQGRTRFGFFALYMVHNHHFFSFAEMMRGRSAEALRMAREMTARIPDDFLDDYGFIADGFTAFVPEVLMRFGRWEELLREEAPRRQLPYAMAKWHFTRVTALTALGRSEEASAERRKFDAAVRRLPADAAVGNNAAKDLLSIAALVMDGESAAKRGDLDAAIAALEAAKVREDALRYDEPPDWIQPVRHTLGAVQLRAGKFSDAERTYREDLTKWPENGWSLYGLAQSLRLQKKRSEADDVADRFERAWADADVPIESTCFCQPGVSSSATRRYALRADSI